MIEGLSSEGEEGSSDASNALINKMYLKGNELKIVLKMYHPNKTVASSVINLFNDKFMSHFDKIVKQAFSKI